RPLRPDRRCGGPGGERPRSHQHSGGRPFRDHRGRERALDPGGPAPRDRHRCGPVLPRDARVAGIDRGSPIVPTPAQSGRAGSPQDRLAGITLVDGMKPGFLYGRTAEDRPFVAVENPVTIRDLHATLYRAMGIPANQSYKVEKRPFLVTEDG